MSWDRSKHAGADAERINQQSGQDTPKALVNSRGRRVQLSATVPMISCAVELIRPSRS